MVVKRALVLFLAISFIAAGIPSRARAAEPKAPAGAEAFVNSLLQDAEVQQLLQAVANGIPPATKEQLQQFAQLAVSGATPEDLREQLQLILSNLPEATQADIEQLVYRLFSVAGVGLMAGAIAKFKQHKNNPQQIHVGAPVAQLFIAAALLFIPSIFSSTGGTLFSACPPSCSPTP
jgi:hypothetical protein